MSPIEFMRYHVELMSIPWPFDFDDWFDIGLAVIDEDLEFVESLSYCL